MVVVIIIIIIIGIVIGIIIGIIIVVIRIINIPLTLRSIDKQHQPHSHRPTELHSRLVPLLDSGRKHVSWDA